MGESNTTIRSKQDIQQLKASIIIIINIIAVVVVVVVVSKETCKIVIKTAAMFNSFISRTNFAVRRRGHVIITTRLLYGLDFPPQR